MELNIACALEIDAKAALSKLTLLVTEFANCRGTPSISRIDVFKEDMETLDEITHFVRSSVKTGNFKTRLTISKNK